MEEINAIKEAISLNRQELLDQVLFQLGIHEIDQSEFEAILGIIEIQDLKRDKYVKALDAQVVIDDVLKNKLT